MTIKFPSDLGWYKELPCTTFRSLQHRKERTGFWHEYIVLEFVDGSICRLERMGDPYARVEALSPQGTTAHDIAQCFRPEAIPTACLDSSDIITQIAFPCDLDFMDVLRICRAIQEGEETCSYTLLSSNCYFFCLAIQAGLTRLVTSWTIQRPPDDRVSAVRNSVNVLADTQSTPDHQDFLLLRIYSVFSGSARLVDSIGEEVAPVLEASFIQSHVNQALGAELWHSNLGSITDLALETIIKEAVGRALMKQELLCQDIHTNTMSSQTHLICSQACIYCCKRAVNYLVSLAIKQHENQVRNVSATNKRANLSSALALGLKVNQLDFRPPTASSQRAGYSLDRIQLAFVWMQHMLSAIAWFLNIVVGLFWIRPTSFMVRRRSVLIDEDICLRLDRLQHPYNLQDVCEILQTTLNVQQAAIKWNNWPWAFVHDLIREQLSEYVHVQDSNFLVICTPVGPSFLPLATLVIS